MVILEEKVFHGFELEEVQNKVYSISVILFDHLKDKNVELREGPFFETL